MDSLTEQALELAALDVKDPRPWLVAEKRAAMAQHFRDRLANWLSAYSASAGETDVYDERAAAHVFISLEVLGRLARHHAERAAALKAAELPFEA